MDLEADLENLASEISGKDDILGLDVDLQYNSPQFNRLSPLDAQYNMGGSPWSRGFEAERINRLTPRLSSSPGGSPFLRIKSGSFTRSPDLLASFLKSEGSDSPLSLHRQVALHNSMNSGRSSPSLSSPILPRQTNSGRVPGVETTPQHPDRQRKPIFMLPPRSSVPTQILEPDSPLAMKRSKKAMPIPQTSRQRVAIPTSPTLPRRTTEGIPQPPRRPTPAPYYLPEGGSISPARLQAALCSLQSAALSDQHASAHSSTASTWPGYMHERPQASYTLPPSQFEDPTLAPSRDLQNLALRDRIPARLPELTSPMVHGSPFVDRSRTREPIAREKVTREKVTREKITHEQITTTAMVVAGSPVDKKDRLRRRREIHSAVERRRRDITNSVLNQLAVLVTTKNMPESKMYKSEILQHSVQHILHSHDVLREFAAELRRLHPSNHVLSKYQTFLEGLVTEEDVMQNAPARIR